MTMEAVEEGSGSFLPKAQERQAVGHGSIETPFNAENVTITGHTNSRVSRAGIVATASPMAVTMASGTKGLSSNDATPNSDRAMEMVNLFKE